MTTIERLIDGGLVGDDGPRVLTLDRSFQGLPDTAHGGSVLAVFDRAAGVDGPREVLGIYRRRVPPGVALRLEVARAGRGAVLALRDERGPLVDGHVLPLPAGEAVLAAVGAGGYPLPVSATCFACGIDNPVGLRLHLRFDDNAVWGEYSPGHAFRTGDGTVTPAALTTALDETAFWLGALATGEAGMTTEVRVKLHRRPAWGEPLLVSGARRRVHPLEADSRYVGTATAVHDPSGRLVASGQITFVSVRGAARRLAAALLGLNPPGVVHRVFPAYAAPGP